MNRTTKSEGFGRAPFHGAFHTILSLIILGLSAYLFHQFRRGGPNYSEPLRKVYLYDLIVSVLAVGGGLLLCLPVIGHAVVLAIALLLPILFIIGFGWTEYEHHHLAKFLPHHGIATTLVVFLAIAAFLGLIAFIYEISMFRRRSTTSRSAVV